jgi:hypothetical protein
VIASTCGLVGRYDVPAGGAGGSRTSDTAPAMQRIEVTTKSAISRRVFILLPTVVVVVGLTGRIRFLYVLTLHRMPTHYASPTTQKPRNRIANSTIVPGFTEYVRCHGNRSGPQSDIVEANTADVLRAARREGVTRNLRTRMSSKRGWVCRSELSLDHINQPGRACKVSSARVTEVNVIDVEKLA